MRPRFASLCMVSTSILIALVGCGATPRPVVDESSPARSSAIDPVCAALDAEGVQPGEQAELLGVVDGLADSARDVVPSATRSRDRIAAVVARVLGDSGLQPGTSRSVSEAIQTKRGACFELSIVVSGVLRRLGVRADLGDAPGHVFVWASDEQGEDVLIETTDGGRQVSRDYYREWLGARDPKSIRRVHGDGLRALILTQVAVKQFARGDSRSGDARLRAALALDQQQAAAWLATALRHLERGQLPGARDAARRAVQECPDWLPAWSLLAVVESKQQGASVSEEAQLRIRQHPTRLVDEWMTAVRLFHDAAMVEMANSCAGRLIDVIGEKLPDAPKATRDRLGVLGAIALGAAYSDDLELMAKVMRQAVREDRRHVLLTSFWPLEVTPPHARAWVVVALARRLLGRDEAALDAARNAIASDENWGVGHLIHGILLHRGGNVDAATRSFQRAQELGVDLSDLPESMADRR